MALKQVKNKIIATKKTGQVTKAMEAVSAVKMRKSQEKAFAGRPYIRSALRILAQLSASEGGSSRRFSNTPKTATKHLLVVVTSDKGLAGSVNSAVLKKADEIIVGKEEVEVIAVGRKAVEYAAREKLTLYGEYTNVSDVITLADVQEISALIVDKFLSGSYKRVSIVYQNFISTFEQNPTVRTILPLDSAEIEYIMRGIKPKTGRFSDTEEVPTKVADYLIEPSGDEVLNSLVPQLVNIIVYHGLIESKASEHSARMVAMKNATDKSKEIIKSLTIKYNKERQAAITAEVSEITAGAEAMNN